jgi:hypothetical protein
LSIGSPVSFQKGERPAERLFRSAGGKTSLTVIAKLDQS